MIICLRFGYARRHGARVQCLFAHYTVIITVVTYCTGISRVRVQFERRSYVYTRCSARVYKKLPVSPYRAYTRLCYAATSVIGRQTKPCQ